MGDLAKSGWQKFLGRSREQWGVSSPQDAASGDQSQAKSGAPKVLPTSGGPQNTILSDIAKGGYQKLGA